MWKKVDQYSLAWHSSDNVGMIYFKLYGGGTGNIQPKSIQELAALGDILRNEKPIYYHTTLRAISTGWEPTGELEI